MKKNVIISLHSTLSIPIAIFEFVYSITIININIVVSLSPKATPLLSGYTSDALRYK